MGDVEQKGKIVKLFTFVNCFLPNFWGLKTVFVNEETFVDFVWWKLYANFGKKSVVLPISKRSLKKSGDAYTKGTSVGINVRYKCKVSFKSKCLAYRKTLLLTFRCHRWVYVYITKFSFLNMFYFDFLLNQATLSLKLSSFMFTLQLCLLRLEYKNLFWYSKAHVSFHLLVLCHIILIFQSISYFKLKSLINMYLINIFCKLSNYCTIDLIMLYLSF